MGFSGVLEEDLELGEGHADGAELVEDMLGEDAAEPLLVGPGDRVLAVVFHDALLSGL